MLCLTRVFLLRRHSSVVALSRVDSSLWTSDEDNTERGRTDTTCETRREERQGERRRRRSNVRSDGRGVSVCACWSVPFGPHWVESERIPIEYLRRRCGCAHRTHMKPAMPPHAHAYTARSVVVAYLVSRFSLFVCRLLLCRRRCPFPLAPLRDRAPGCREPIRLKSLAWRLRIDTRGGGGGERREQQTNITTQTNKEEEETIEKEEGREREIGTEIVIDKRQWRRTRDLSKGPWIWVVWSLQ